MLKVYIDGASRGNPGPAAAGFVIFDSDGNELFRFGKKIGICTNNYAEYCALIEALNCIAENSYFSETSKGPTENDGYSYLSDERIFIYSDSELLVRQMNNRYRVRSCNLISLFKEAKNIVERKGSIIIEHIKRNNNRVADWIVNRVLNDKNYHV